MKHRTLFFLVFLGIFWRVSPAQAVSVVPVIDAANLIQTTISAIYNILSVANQILELTPLDEIILDEAFTEDLGAIAEIVGTAQGLAYDIDSLNRQITMLFDLGGVPTNATDFQLRVREIRRVVVEAYIMALRTQTLLKTFARTVTRIRQLVSQVGAFLGNMQSNQNLAQAEAQTTQVLARIDGQITVYYRAQSIERITEPMVIESLTIINEEVRRDYPR